ncbi:unnamed protein product [Arctia plantaginis]|uniref:Uncharacterized protein n=1 Tax=Arctia plantaginis TaxID=874455 RepID=A0A8S1BPD5_ARCPL|nr:unnamed protein product [Arctia plantaginis]
MVAKFAIVLSLAAAAYAGLLPATKLCSSDKAPACQFCAYIHCRKGRGKMLNVKTCFADRNSSAIPSPKGF